jgi:hypothetical protein
MVHLKTRIFGSSPTFSTILMRFRRYLLFNRNRRLTWFGIVSINHLSDNISLIPDAKRSVQASAWVSLICHNFEGIQGVFFAEPADPS